MTTLISVENLSKIYRLGQIGTGTFTNDLKLWWARTRGKPNPLLKIGEADHGNRDGEDIWALRDISFTVERGEVLGIIGRNGAGKSTLLKILSRITAPTSGRIRVRGRVASLLEVGTGFHPEMTGRENIYLNGAILGMSRREIDRKFDEIVDFSEVEKFIDTPVKRYSSGMYVRLAFAVAAHLEPEILVVDEVLAVGDAAFQKKCLGKMGDVAKEGRTVLFVSHNMGAVSRITERCIWIEQGRLKEIGSTENAVHGYLQDSGNKDQGGYDGELNGPVVLRELLLHDISGVEMIGTIPFATPFLIRARWHARENVKDISFFIRIEAEDGTIIATLNSHDSLDAISLYKHDEVMVDWAGLNNFLLPGRYYLTLAIHDGYRKPMEVYRNALELRISDVNAPQRFSHKSSVAGHVYFSGNWKLNLAHEKEPVE